ncbi:hypothetical protein [Marinifilum sp. D737]|uniref:hypothetical protein n=1 Tax=Marinifilum sp. D737 TaxID=2969628 RepID=UPI002276E1C5|nr:hypothetical protein [Marinifilum sp. D737]MCY1635932.1 hypothetical protein [Marinifilum sp. D737]
MKSRIFVSILITLMLVGCNLNSKERYQNQYDIDINYNHYKKVKRYARKYMDERYQRNGNVYLFFETSFENDTVRVTVNNKLKYQDVIATEASTGIANSYEIENINEVFNIGIRVNNGKEALIEIDTMNLFTIEFRDSILRVDVLNHVPVYD